jgi:hypothetical protein
VSVPEKQTRGKQRSFASLFRPALLSLLAFVLLLPAFAQTGSDPTRFKVASSRPAVPQKVSGCIGAMGGGRTTNDPAFSYLGTPLVSVLEWAYGTPTFHIFRRSELAHRTRYPQLRNRGLGPARYNRRAIRADVAES